jgi:hypothetical protein
MTDRTGYETYHQASRPTRGGALARVDGHEQRREITVTFITHDAPQCGVVPPSRPLGFGADGAQSRTAVRASAPGGDQQRMPQYRAMNPAALMPMLETDDGTLITQMLANLESLDATPPSPLLLWRDRWREHTCGSRY